jgi:hypothetical protein
MNAQQKIALEHHCRFGFETGQRRFAFLDPGGRCSVVLSVNSGYE